jgi:hypothetical protein
VVELVTGWFETTRNCSSSASISKVIRKNITHLYIPATTRSVYLAAAAGGGVVRGGGAGARTAGRLSPSCLVCLVRQVQAFDVTKDAFFVVVATAGNVVYSRLPSRNVRACWRSACVGEMKRG